MIDLASEMFERTQQQELLRGQEHSFCDMECGNANEIIPATCGGATSLGVVWSTRLLD